MVQWEKMRYFGGKEKHFKKKLLTFEKKFFIKKEKDIPYIHIPTILIGIYI